MEIRLNYVLARKIRYKKYKDSNSPILSVTFNFTPLIFTVA